MKKGTTRQNISSTDFSGCLFFSDNNYLFSSVLNNLYQIFIIINLHKLFYLSCSKLKGMSASLV